MVIKNILIDRGKSGIQDNLIGPKGVNLSKQNHLIEIGHHSNNFIGETIKLKCNEHGLFMDANIADNTSTDVLQLYPSIGIIVEDSHTNEDGVRVINKCRIFSISLSNIQNSDSEIKTIGEQIKSNNLLSSPPPPPPPVRIIKEGGEVDPPKVLSHSEYVDKWIEYIFPSGNVHKIKTRLILTNAMQRGGLLSVQHADYKLDEWTKPSEITKEVIDMVTSDPHVRKIRIEIEM